MLPLPEGDVHASLARCRGSIIGEVGGEGVSRLLPFFVGNLTCALSVTAFCPRFPKPRRSTSLQIIKITSTVP